MSSQGIERKTIYKQTVKNQEIKQHKKYRRWARGMLET